MNALLLSMLLSQASVFHYASEPVYVPGLGLYHAFVILSPSSASLGPSAPGFATCGIDNGGVDVAGGAEFDTVNVRAIFPSSALACYDTSRDMLLQVALAAQDNDPFAEGETFNWAFDYRTPNLLAGEGWETGNLATVTATYTQAATGAGVECAGGFVLMALPRGDAYQGYTIGDSLSGALRRAAGGTYSGDPFIGAVLWLIPIFKTCHQG